MNLFRERREGDDVPTKCDFCGKKIKGKLSYFYGPGVAHIEVVCSYCGANYEYDDYEDAK